MYIHSLTLLNKQLTVKYHVADNLEDHDLLIELRTEVKGMREDIRDLKDGTSNRLSELEHKVGELEAHKASKNDLKETNSRVERINTRQNLILGGLILANILLPLILNYLSR